LIGLNHDGSNKISGKVRETLLGKLRFLEPKSYKNQLTKYYFYQLEAHIRFQG